jgi:hypothetical protein
VKGRVGVAIGGTGFGGVDRIYVKDRVGCLQALGGPCGNVLVSLAALGHNVTPIVGLARIRRGISLCRSSVRRAPVLPAIGETSVRRLRGESGF